MLRIWFLLLFCSSYLFSMEKDDMHAPQTEQESAKDEEFLSLILKYYDEIDSYVGLIHFAPNLLRLLREKSRDPDFENRKLLQPFNSLHFKKLQALLSKKYKSFPSYFDLGKMTDVIKNLADEPEDDIKIPPVLLSGTLKDYSSWEDLLGFRRGALEAILVNIYHLFMQPDLEKKIDLLLALRQQLSVPFEGLIKDYFETEVPSLAEQLQKMLMALIHAYIVRGLKQSLMATQQKVDPQNSATIHQSLEFNQLQQKIVQAINTRLPPPPPPAPQENGVRPTPISSNPSISIEAMNRWHQRRSSNPTPLHSTAAKGRERQSSFSSPPRHPPAESQPSKAPSLITQPVFYDNFPQILDWLETNIDRNLDDAGNLLEVIGERGLLAMAQSDKELLEKYVTSHQLWTYFKALMKAGTLEKAPRIGALMNAIHWDIAIELVADYFGYVTDSEKESNGTKIKVQLLFYFLEMNELKRFIRNFQKGDEVTENSLKSVYFHWALPHLLDYKKAAGALNRLRSGANADLWEAIKLKNIEKVLAVDLRAALNPYIPERVQIAEHTELWRQYTDMRLYNHVRNAMTYSLPPIMLWLFMRACLPSLMSCLEPHWFVASILLPLAGALYLAGSDFFKQPAIKNSTALNIIATQLSFQAHSYFRKITTPEDIEGYVKDTDPHAPFFRSFLTLLSPKHLELLRDPYTLIELLENPVSFVRTSAYQPFLLCLCSIEGEYAEPRLFRLFQMLYPHHALEDLPHNDAFVLFARLVSDHLEKLPCPSFLLLAWYNPALLLTQAAFIRAIARITFDDGENALDLLYTLIDEAQGFNPQQPQETPHEDA